MLKNHKTKSVLKIVSVFLLMINFVLAHEDERESAPLRYTFKQRIHELCSGHGLMHLKPLEIQKICNLFSENSTDIASLQQTAVSDKFLSQLTGLIIYSDVPKEKKQKMLRDSYEISLDKSEEGSDWGYTIGILIEKTDILSVEELTSHTQSSNQYLKSVSKRYLQQKLNKNPSHQPNTAPENKTIKEKETEKNETRIKPNEKSEIIHPKGGVSEEEKNLTKKTATISEQENPLNNDTPENNTSAIIVGGLCIGITLLILVNWKRMKN